MVFKYKPPLLGFGVEDITNEFELPCLDQEEDIVALVNDTPIDYETFIDDIIYLESLHQATGVIHRGINHYFQNFFFPPFSLK